MKIQIEAEPKEIADLIIQIQSQPHLGIDELISYFSEELKHTNPVH